MYKDFENKDQSTEKRTVKTFFYKKGAIGISSLLVKTFFVCSFLNGML